ncbi:hypothetical protein MTO96_049327 [Rhipicephalus appendiculatus]
MSSSDTDPTDGGRCPEADCGQHGVDAAEGSSASAATQTEEKTPAGVRQKLRTLTFGRRRSKNATSSSAAATKDQPSSSRDCKPARKGGSGWGFKLGCRSRRTASSAADPVASDHPTGCPICICTGYRRTEERSVDADASVRVTPPRSHGKFSCNPDGKYRGDEYQVDDWDERARKERAREIEEGVDPPPGFRSDGRPSTSSSSSSSSEEQPRATVPSPQPLQQQLPELALALRNQLSFASGGNPESLSLPWEVLSQIWDVAPQVHTQVDYMHCLVPDLLGITSCGFYWGKMDRYEAERLLENKPEGTFLLRDSAQEEYLFSVSFRRYGRSLHARVEQWNHRFSFDSHDPGVFSSRTVCGLVEHYKDPSCCMYFEPMLTRPLHRTFVFPLQHLARAVICSCIAYDGAAKLPLPRSLKSYLREYHYKQRVRVRQIEDGGTTVQDFGPSTGRGYGLLGASALNGCHINPDVG